MYGSLSSASSVSFPSHFWTFIHDHRTQPGVSLIGGGITPVRTRASTVLSEQLSSRANSLRPMYDGGRSPLPALVAFVMSSNHNPYYPRAAKCQRRSRKAGSAPTRPSMVGLPIGGVYKQPTKLSFGIPVLLPIVKENPPIARPALSNSPLQNRDICNEPAPRPSRRADLRRSFPSEHFSEEPADSEP
jgi:hypothetical protein